MNWITTALQALVAIFGFAQKVVPSDKMREEEQERGKARAMAGEFTKAYDKAFMRLKSHTEIDIRADVTFTYPDMIVEQRELLIELLEARIKRHRHRHPLIFREWIMKNP